MRIYDSPAYQLDAIATDHPVVGTTVQLFQTFPQARRPRRQRIVSFTLPPEALAKLAALVTSRHVDEQEWVAHLDAAEKPLTVRLDKDDHTLLYTDPHGRPIGSELNGHLRIFL